MSRGQVVTAAQIVAAVRVSFGAERDGAGPEWAALDEFTGMPGAWGSHRRADLFLVRAWSSKPRGHERVLVEVKVTRADLRHELDHPEKMAALARFAHRVYFATPVGLVTSEDLGPGVGLLEVSRSRTQTRLPADRRRDVEPVSEDLFVEAFRRAGRAEARIRQAATDDPAARVAQLEHELARSWAAEQRARQAADRDKGRLDRWLRAVADAGGVRCECGKAIAPRSKDLRGRLRHADATDCELDLYGGYARPDVEGLAARLAPEDVATSV